MKFNPCTDLCTYDDTHCSGCGRSHEEIAKTKALVTSIVNFVQEQDYENVEKFVGAISKSVIKKSQPSP